MKDSTSWGADGPGAEGPEPLRGDDLRRFRAALRAWYAPRARPLRIRTTHDAWAILVSEVMAQQTQIARVDAAWATFMARYPTPAALATAATAGVLERAFGTVGAHGLDFHRVGPFRHDNDGAHAKGPCRIGGSNHNATLVSLAADDHRFASQIWLLEHLHGSVKGIQVKVDNGPHGPPHARL